MSKFLIAFLVFFTNVSVKGQEHLAMPPEKGYALYWSETLEMLDNLRAIPGADFLFGDTIYYEARDSLKQLVESGFVSPDNFNSVRDMHDYCIFMGLNKMCMGKTWTQEPLIRLLHKRIKIDPSAIVKNDSMISFVLGREDEYMGVRKYRFHLDSNGVVNYVITLNEKSGGKFIYGDSTCFTYSGTELQASTGYFYLYSSSSTLMDTLVTEVIYRNGLKRSSYKYRKYPSDNEHSRFKSNFTYDNSGRLRRVENLQSGEEKRVYEYSYGKDKVDVVLVYRHLGAGSGARLKITFSSVSPKRNN